LYRGEKKGWMGRTDRRGLAWAAWILLRTGVLEWRIRTADEKGVCNDSPPKEEDGDQNPGLQNNTRACKFMGQV